jgi:hypothetical protein
MPGIVGCAVTYCKGLQRCLEWKSCTVDVDQSYLIVILFYIFSVFPAPIMLLPSCLLRSTTKRDFWEENDTQQGRTESCVR